MPERVTNGRSVLLGCFCNWAGSTWFGSFFFRQFHEPFTRIGI